MVVQLTKYVYNTISLDLLANTMFLEAISLSCSHDSITKSIISPLKVWLVALQIEMRKKIRKVYEKKRQVEVVDKFFLSGFQSYGHNPTGNIVL